MKRIVTKLGLISGLLMLLATFAGAQTKEIAFTIDDLPLNGPSVPLERLRKMTSNIVGSLQRNKAPMVGFVNEGLLYPPGETDARIAILKQWKDGGTELGNHTFSHHGLTNDLLRDYEDDFLRGDAVTKLIMAPAKPRYFRHPFLKMADTREFEEKFRQFIGERGYTAVPATVDTMDWMFVAAYLKAINENDAKLKKNVAEEYLKFAAAKIDAAEAASTKLFGRSIKHIMVLHANELNGDHFDALLKVYAERGYRFITVEEALKDEVYRWPDRYSSTSNWLGHWAFSKNVPIDSPAPPAFIEKIFQGK